MLINVNYSSKCHSYSFVKNLGEIFAVKLQNCTVKVKNNSFICIFSASFNRRSSKWMQGLT